MGDRVAGATAATGSLSGTAAAALALSGQRAEPATITPNGDGQADTTTISYTLSANANVAVSVLDAGGATVAAARAEAVAARGGPQRRPRRQRTWRDGDVPRPRPANATGGRSATVDVPVTVTRTLGLITLAAAAITPNGDGRNDTLSLVVPLGAPATLTVRIVRDGKWVATPFAAAVDVGHADRDVGRLEASREGARRALRRVDRGGRRRGTATVELPFAVDATAPVVRVVLGDSRPVSGCRRRRRSRSVSTVPAA